MLVSKKTEQYIQLRTKSCKDVSVHLQDKEFLSKETSDIFTDFTCSTNLYLDADRARKLGFALLSAANKLQRKK